MTKTQHFAKQMHNRGITHTMVELVELFGYQVGDRVILDKKQIHQLLHRINVVRDELIKMYQKGGVAVVEKNGSMITAFPITQRMGRVKQKYKWGG
ncbi:MAG: hypothetical protein N3F66_14660 [Spirochaetes bacterium]|nr:hypothetical protein [Spirochaetota bacterium]